MLSSTAVAQKYFLEALPLKDHLQFYQILIGLAFFCRVLMAFFSVDFDHPHEIFRTLEPIAFLQGYTV
jgi:hypothetical protein